MGSRRLRLGSLQFDLPGKVDCRLGSIWLESKTPATKQVARTRKFAFENERVTFKEILSPGDGKTFPQVPCGCIRVDVALPHECRYLFLRLCPLKTNPAMYTLVCVFLWVCVFACCISMIHMGTSMYVRLYVCVCVCVCAC